MPGVLYNRDARFAHRVMALLNAEDGLVVGDNAPYMVSDASDYTIPVHAERRGLHHVLVEIRQDLIADRRRSARMGAPLGAPVAARLSGFMRSKTEPGRSADLSLLFRDGRKMVDANFPNRMIVIVPLEMHAHHQPGPIEVGI